MSMIGDILVKFTADFAQFATGMADAQRQIGAFGSKLDEQNGTLAKHGTALEGVAKQLADLGKSSSVDQFSSKLDSLGETLAKFGAIGAVAAAAIGAVFYAVSKGREIEDYALAVDKLATTYKLTIDQAKGLDLMMRQTGRSAEDLTKALTPNQLGFIGDYYKAQFGDTAKQIEDVTKASNKLSDAWNDLQEQAKQSLVSTFGEWTAAALDALTAAVNAFSAAMREAAARAAALPQHVKEGRGNTDTALQLATPEEKQQYEAQQAAAERARQLVEDTAKLGDYRKQYAEAQAQIAQGLDRGGMIAADVDNLGKKIETLTAKVRELAGATNALGAGGALGGLAGRFGGAVAALPTFQGAGPSIIGPTPLPGSSELARLISQAHPAITSTSGGGGGKTDDDYLDAQTRRYAALQVAAEKAYKTIEDYTGSNVEDLQKQVNTQREIDDILGKINAKWLEAHPAARQALETAVTGAENARAAQDKLLESTKAAIDIDNKYGTGQKALQKIHEDIAKAKSTNKTSTDALTAAEKAQTEAAAQATLEGKRYRDNLESLAAGFEHAANAYARSNDLYNTGEQAFGGLITSMGEGLDVLAGKSNKTFEQIAADFALMLSKMALQAALSAVFKAVFGAISFTPEFATPTGYADVSAGSLTDYFSRPRAGGGPVYPGTSYLVGEAGPERFVPTVAGQIVPNAALNSGGGGVMVNVNMSGTAPPSAQDTANFARRLKQAVLDTIQNEQRPGGTLYRGAG